MWGKAVELNQWVDTFAKACNMQNVDRNLERNKCANSYILILESVENNQIFNARSKEWWKINLIVNARS